MFVYNTWAIIMCVRRWRGRHCDVLWKSSILFCVYSHSLSVAHIMCVERVYIYHVYYCWWLLCVAWKAFLRGIILQPSVNGVLFHLYSWYLCVAWGCVWVLFGMPLSRPALWEDIVVVPLIYYCWWVVALCHCTLRQAFWWAMTLYGIPGGQPTQQAPLAILYYSCHMVGGFPNSSYITCMPFPTQPAWEEKLLIILSELVTTLCYL